MTLTKIKNAKIVGIDRNPRSVVRARNLINRKNLDEHILIENENGFNYPMSDFDLIVVSGCSIPKIKVLKHIFKEAKPNCKIIVREGENSINSILGLINSYDDIEIVDEIICDPFPTMSWKSFYLVKK
jgi:SAM-dependent methyltransferase